MKISEMILALHQVGFSVCNVNAASTVIAKPKDGNKSSALKNSITLEANLLHQDYKVNLHFTDFEISAEAFHSVAEIAVAKCIQNFYNCLRSALQSSATEIVRLEGLTTVDNSFIDYAQIGDIFPYDKEIEVKLPSGLGSIYYTANTCQWRGFEISKNSGTVLEPKVQVIDRTIMLLNQGYVKCRNGMEELVKLFPTIIVTAPSVIPATADEKTKTSLASAKPHYRITNIDGTLCKAAAEFWYRGYLISFSTIMYPLPSEVSVFDGMTEESYDRPVHNCQTVMEALEWVNQQVRTKPATS